MDGPPENSVCSICHQRNFRVPCEANCGHWFCGSCIYQCWLLGDVLHPCRCRLCGREITLLIPSEASLNMGDNDAEVLRNIQKYNRRHCGRTNGLVEATIERIRDLPFLLRRLLRDMKDPRRSLPLSIWARCCLAMTVCVLYVLSPLDLVPEALLPIFGVLDDLILVLLCILYVADIYRAALLARHQGA